jgi:hypothetical protein
MSWQEPDFLALDRVGVALRRISEQLKSSKPPKPDPKKLRRERIATAVMTGLCAGDGFVATEQSERNRVAETAVLLADALIKALDKGA